MKLMKLSLSLRSFQWRQITGAADKMFPCLEGRLETTNFPEVSSGDELWLHKGHNIPVVT